MSSAVIVVDFVGSADRAERLTRSLNLHRRHLTGKQKKEALMSELKRDPSRSDRQIAVALGVDHKTVGAVREGLNGTGEIPQLTETTGADGKTYPRTREQKISESLRKRHAPVYERVDAALRARR